MKRTFAILIAFLLIFSTLPLNQVFAAADVTPPTIESITVDRTTATVGDTVKISVKASDNVGIRQVFVEYPAPITRKDLSILLKYNSANDLYEGSFTVTNSTENGLFKVGSVSVYDTSDNYTTIGSYNDSQHLLDSGQFTVSGTTGADVTPPVVDSISVDKTSVTVGDTVKISLKASDDVGIQTIYFSYNTPVTGKISYIGMYYNSVTHLYEGSFTVTDESEPGLYKINQVLVRDTSDNDTTINRYNDTQHKLDSGEFTVTGSNGGDLTPPVVESISVDKTRVTAGDRVKVSMKATDNVAISTVNFTYMTPITGKFITINMNYNPSTQLYEGAFTVTKDEENGLYKIGGVLVTDTSNNNTYLTDSEDPQNLLSSGQFVVYPDNTPPSFTSISVDKKTVAASGQLTLTVEAADDAHLQSATVTYTTPSRLKKTVTLGFDGQHFTGKMPIDVKTEVGNWTVVSVEITDMSGNSTVVNSGLSNGDFTVLTPKIGWVKDGDSWYFYNDQGVMQTGWLTQGSTRYYLKSGGAMQTGWAKIGTSWYYFKSTGAMQTGWAKIGTVWYYFGSTGVMQTGWAKVGTTWYYFDTTSGAMKTGWLKLGNTWYYFDTGGAMKTGWVKLGSSWYYFDSSGAMKTGWVKISGKLYYFNSSGQLR